MIFRVGMTLAPVLIGVFILSQASAASDFIMAVILILAGVLGGALLWWDARRARRK